MKLPAWLSLAFLAATAAQALAQTPDWTEKKPTTSPAARAWHAMAFDAARQRTVLFGGQNNNVSLNDTWLWDGRNWTRANPTASPTARNGHAMAYDSARQRVVMWGGTAATGRFLRDTWEWDGVTWRKIALTSANKPTSRIDPRMTYDSNRRRIVLFGGFDTVKGDSNEVWEYSGIRWQKMPSITTAPPGRQSHAVTFDSNRGRTVVFGGDNTSGRLNDTWEWDGIRWQQVTTTTSPTARRASNGFVYDHLRRRVVLFGGFDNNGTLNDTWEYDGTNWQPITTATTPTIRERAAMVFDTVRGRTVMFGGTQVGARETWEYWGSPCSLTADKTNLPITTGGTQTLKLVGSPTFANLPYWIFGSITGTSPGIRLNGIDIPLNVDVYTQLAMQNVTANPPFNGFRGLLDSKAEATAQFILPPRVLQSQITLYHAFLVFDGTGRFYCASNAVPLRMN